MLFVLLVFTWVYVKLAFHSLGNALQFDSLQGAVRMDGGRQAAQSLPDETGHLAHREDLQQLAVNCRKCSEEHGLRIKRECSLTGAGATGGAHSCLNAFSRHGITVLKTMMRVFLYMYMQSIFYHTSFTNFNDVSSIIKKLHPNDTVKMPCSSSQPIRTDSRRSDCTAAYSS